MVALIAVFVFLMVLVLWQIIISSGASKTDSLIKQRLGGVVLGHGHSETSIIKEKYYNRLGYVERNLEHFPGMPELKALLERAGKKQMAYRFALYMLLSASSVALVSWGYSRQPIMALVMFIVMIIAPIMWLKNQQAKRVDKFEEQLPEALQMMSRALRAGYPLTESMKIVSIEMSEPISQEFGMTFEEINYGRDIELAFALMIERIPSISLIAMVSAVLIQKDTGGNLSEVLMKISNVLMGRFKMQRRIKTLSAEGTLSAWVMILMPIFLFFVMNIMSPDYFKLVYLSPHKMTFLYIFIGLEVVATIWIRKIINIDI
jgi:tight adherence protein B